MQELKRILVCIDLSEIDKSVISYASRIADMMESEKVDFLHVSETNVASSQSALEKEVNGIFSSKTPTSVNIQMGKTAESALSWAGLHRSQLIILGKKKKTESSAKHATKIINKALCSVLLIPAMENYSFETLLVPIDFSVGSKMSIDQALKLKEKGNSKVILQHVFYAHSGYTTSGKTYEEYGAILQKNAEKEYQRFMKENEYDQSPFEIIFTLDDDSKPFDNIYETAKEKSADMIFLSSRGHTPAAAIIKGSTTLNLMQYDDDIPFFIVKNEKERMGFWEALMKI